MTKFRRVLLTFSQAALFVAMLQCLTAAAEMPNIVLVLFDDLGYGQPPCYSASTTFKMPNLDRLANEGMRFTDAHSAAAVCTPTRYGLLTGRYPSRIGQFGVLTTFSDPIIPVTRPTIASFLQQQGYVTACVGKWHLGWNWVDGKPGDETRVPIGSTLTNGPNAVGFDYFCGFTHARNIGTVVEQDAVIANIEAVENQPLMIQKAVSWIDSQAKSDKPFFLYFPMCPPHTPVVPANAFLGQSGAEDLVQQDPNYGDWILQGDSMLGELLDALDRNGFAKNTLVIATSDNGAEHRPYAPLRESKRSIYEGGHRVPFVVRWPGKVSPGSDCDATICLNDIFATSAEIVGVSVPEGTAEDSHSILSLLLQQESRRENLSIIHQSMSGDLALRQGDWKMIFLIDGKRELYNLKDDPSETSDLSTSHVDTANQLTDIMLGAINRGRTTNGPARKNDFPLSLESQAKKPVSGKKKAPGSK